MSKTKTSGETSEQVESAPFTLILPAAINLTPIYTVDLPRNKQAMIYEVDVIDENKMSRQRYDAYVVSKKTLQTTRDTYNCGRGHQFSNIPALKHWLYDVAAQLSVKKRTRKMVDVQDLTDADDDE